MDHRWLRGVGSARALGGAALVCLTALPVAGSGRAGAGPVVDPVTVRVFRDLNWNSVRDVATSAGWGEPGQAGVQIRVTDRTGVSANATTDTNGAAVFSPAVLAGLDGPRLRVEVVESSVPAHLKPAPAGVGASARPWVSTIEVASGPATIDVGMVDPSRYVAPDAALVNPRQWGGPYEQFSNIGLDLPALIAIDRDAGVDSSVVPPDFLAHEAPAAVPMLRNSDQAELTRVDAIGSVNGVASAAYPDRTLLFAGAFGRMAAPWGPGGPGAIYVLNETGGVLSTLQVPGAAPAVPTRRGIDPIPAMESPTRSDAQSSAICNDPGVSDDQYFVRDACFFGQVGKEGVGGVTVHDGHLYAIGLHTRHVYRFDISNPDAIGAAQDLGAVPDPGCPAGSADWRPFPISFFDSAMYVGGTCTGETRNTHPNTVRDSDGVTLWRNDPASVANYNSGDVAIAVVRADSAAALASAQPVMLQPLDWQQGFRREGKYPRATTGNGIANGRSIWNPWLDEADGQMIGMYRGSVTLYPQPWLTSFDFDADGSLILGVADRTGSQIPKTWAGQGLSDSNQFDPAWGYLTQQAVDGGITTSRYGVSDGDASGDMYRACRVNDPAGVDLFGAQSSWVFEGDPGCATNAPDPLDASYKYPVGDVQEAHEYYVGDWDYRPLTGTPRNTAEGTHGAVVFDPETRQVAVSSLINDWSTGVKWLNNITGVQERYHWSIAGLLHQTAGPAYSQLRSTESWACPQQYVRRDSLGLPRGPLTAPLSYRMLFHDATVGLPWLPQNADPLAPFYDANAVAHGACNHVSLSKTGPTGQLAFVASLGPVEIGDFVWLDADGDGIQDPDETPLVGATIEVVDGAGTVAWTGTTNTDGRWTAAVAPDAGYTVRVNPATSTTVLPGMRTLGELIPTSEGVGAGGTDSSGANTAPRPTPGAAVSFPATAVRAGAANHTFDTGFTLPVSLGDHVWLDRNRNGGQDPGEPPFANVTVTLFAADGTTVVGTTTTDSNGFYSFTDLIPNTNYVVGFTRPDDYRFTRHNAGSDGGDSDADPATGFVGVRSPGSGTNSSTNPDNPTIDAGLVAIDLSVAKRLITDGPYAVGDVVEFELVPSNDGPADAVGGWSVTDVLPKGYAAVSIAGKGGASSGYSCTLVALSCMSSQPLAARGTGVGVVVTAKIVGGAPEDLVNRAFISPASDDVEESNPLSVPDGGTDTDESGTNNDSMVVLHLSEERDPSTPAVPTETPKRLAFTGSQQAAVVVVGGLLLVAGACLVRLRRRRPAAL